jgi:hypothetical protein
MADGIYKTKSKWGPATRFINVKDGLVTLADCDSGYKFTVADFFSVNELV